MNPVLVTALLLATLSFPKEAWPQDPPPPQPPPPTPLEISAAATYSVGEFIDIEAKGGAGKAIRWRFKDPLGVPPQLRYPAKDNKRLIELSYQPGTWTLECSVSDGDTIEDASHTFTIAGVGPGPGPEPPPKPLTLAQLAGDKAAPLSQMYVTIKESIGKPITTFEQFRAAEAAALTANELTGHGATAEIARRTTVTFDKLTAALDAIITELGTPPLPQGKRLVVLIHETEDDDAAMSRLIVNIRDGEIGKYLKAGGHPSPLILDDDLDAPILKELAPALVGVQLPALIILDATTHAVAHKQSTPNSLTEFLAALKKGGA